ncbi:MAG: hypothetical protein AUK63_1458 [bacterium P3]|nr:MAG: hypothetical protein AUK63_1458 [bacterium P3]KWW40048.1 MAG: hypothetical protein F083_1770 [bacterium F083]
MKKLNIYLIVTALLLMVLGVACMIHPGEIFVSMAWLAGLLILLSGCSTLLFGLRAQRLLPNAGSTTLLGVLQIIVGLIFFSNGFIAAGTMVVVFSLWVMFEGISLWVLAFDYKRGGYTKWWVMLLLGFCSMVLGFLALHNPSTTGSVLGFLIGTGIFANGVVRLVALVALKHIGNRLRDLRESATAIPIDDVNPDSAVSDN